ncbi:hypothetical protein JZO66_02880 [Enterococcus sp. DIV0242_7C1]|uniref:Adenosine deaminase domain-containing protein n=2 Tax=Candidatus Enterococcus dunnyi TaxID=1834192 RepID=A0AAQ3Y3D0_9ENTE|nr:hypothetical protein [Enterococcus sp. DIV0242_7C1]MBO0469477.1 hypothetical protein [Enterococcus sp. DIV0242_7C1]
MANYNQLYNDLDRMIRLIYRELTHDYYQKYNIEHDIYYYKNLFDLRDESFQQRIFGKYLQVYPNNYNYDDLKFLLHSITKLLEEEYGQTDAIFLIFYTAKHLFKLDRDELYVEFDKLIEWDGFRNKIDAKLFIAAYKVEHLPEATNYYENSIVKHNNKRLYEIIKRQGISENHMHLKASGYTDDINWYHFLQLGLQEMNRFTDFINQQEVFKEMDRGQENANFLVQSILKIKVIRIVLNLYIIQENLFFETTKKDKLLKTLFNNFNLIFQSDDVLNCLDSLNILSDMIHCEETQTKYWEQQLKDEYDLTKYASHEFLFYQKIMKYIYEEKSASIFVTLLFNLYISGTTHLKFQFIQDNLGMGFSKFKDKEEMKTYFLKGASFAENNAVKRSVFHKYYRERYINNVEIRITPESSIKEYIKTIEDMHTFNDLEYRKAKRELKKKNSILNLKKINFGLIIHFIKPLKSKSLSMTEDWIEKRKNLFKQTTALLETLDAIKQYAENPKNIGWFKGQLTHTIVGIDTANYEKDNRPELFGPIYRRIRQGGTSGFVLKATYHVGEEFPTLANGLRAIDEVLNFLDYRSNDRLGHALALGIDPDDYYGKKRSNILCSIGDYLDDLVWMYSVLVESNQDASLKLFLRDEFEKYKLELFESIMPLKEIPDFNVYLAAYYLRGDCPDLHLELSDQASTEINYEFLCKKYAYKLNIHSNRHKAAFLNYDARSLYLRYSFDDSYRKQAEQVFHIETSELYVQCVARVQRLLQEKVLRMNIFIEANPSSNKKISYVQKYSELPALNISGPIFGKLNNLEIPMSINTDDSSIFLTNLVNEYSMLTASLIRDGYSETDVYSYIEKLAIASNVHSFISEY